MSIFDSYKEAQNFMDHCEVKTYERTLLGPLIAVDEALDYTRVV